MCDFTLAYVKLQHHLIRQSRSSKFPEYGVQGNGISYIWSGLTSPGKRDKIQYVGRVCQKVVLSSMDGIGGVSGWEWKMPINSVFLKNPVFSGAVSSIRAWITLLGSISKCAVGLAATLGTRRIQETWNPFSLLLPYTNPQLSRGACSRQDCFTLLNIFFEIYKVVIIDLLYKKSTRLPGPGAGIQLIFPFGLMREKARPKVTAARMDTVMKTDWWEMPISHPKRGGPKATPINRKLL